MDNKKLWAIHNSENGHWIYVLASSYDNALKAARTVESGYNGGRVCDYDLAPNIIAD